MRGQPALISTKPRAVVTATPRGRNACAAAKKGGKRAKWVPDAPATLKEPSSAPALQGDDELPGTRAAREGEPASGRPVPEDAEAGTLDPLPVVSRGRIFTSCALTAVGMTGLGWIARRVAEDVGPAVVTFSPDVVREVASVPQPFPLEDVAIAAAIAGGVTGARMLLARAWPPFAAATDRSLTQVLGPLTWGDLLWVSGLPAASEEVLFRGGLLVAISPDWVGAVISGAVFGALHVSGRRNTSSAAFATAVGIVYGMGMLWTHDLAVPILAHWLANLSSAAIWKAANGGGPSTSA